MGPPTDTGQPSGAKPTQRVKGGLASGCRNDRTRVQKAVPVLFVNVQLVEQAMADRAQERFDGFGAKVG